VHIVIEGESRPHILMLAWRHQDASNLPPGGVA
jgi:hypothetical protein